MRRAFGCAEIAGYAGQRGAGHLRSDFGNRLVHACLRAAGDDDVGAGAGEAAGDRKADPCGGAGDDGRAATQDDLHGNASGARVVFAALS
jgi:hypothetical protein